MVLYCCNCNYLANIMLCYNGVTTRGEIMVENIDVYDAYHDTDLGVANSRKLRQDMEELGFNKLCMTEVLNADLSIAAYGEDTYFLGCKDVLQKVQGALSQLGLESVVYLYAFNYKNFVLAAGSNIRKEDFLELMKQFYAQFESSASNAVDVSGVSRFVVVLQEDRLIERALHSMLIAKDKQENFLVSPDKMEIAEMIGKDAEVLDLINFALEHKRIVPYYQGIRNNDTGFIDKYEALMRLIDQHGVVHKPSDFLEVAKKYQIYGRLSQVMIAQVLEQFELADVQLSINISAYDIANERFRHWFLNKMQNYKNADRIVIEFVETENYQEGMLFEFIKEIRKCGCRISADDFGSGYATYSAIIALSPDYIKIDGSIIKELASSEDSVIILRSICFMADLVGANTVAEFVESEDIQKVLNYYHVNYSQGFLFSKPKPYDQLELNKKSD